MARGRGWLFCRLEIHAQRLACAEKAPLADEITQQSLTPRPLLAIVSRFRVNREPVAVQVCAGSVSVSGRLWPFAIHWKCSSSAGSGHL